MFMKSKSAESSDGMTLRRIMGFCILTVIAVAGMAAAFELPDGVVITDELNVRRRADVNSEVFWTLNRGEKVKIKAINGEWYKVRLPGEKEGYAHYKYLDVSIWGRVFDQYAVVRTNPDTSAQAMATLQGISWIRVTTRWQMWYGVELPGGNRGWVYQNALEVPQEFFAAWLALQQNAPPPSMNNPGGAVRNTPPPISREPAAMGGGAQPGTLRYQILETAHQYMGTRYVYGGESPSGFDCSGFVWYVFKQHGYKLERVSRSQATMGSYVSRDQLLPGDLVFFDTSRTNSGVVRHAGIYIGNGEFIHASSSNSEGRYVRISPLNDGFYSEHYVTGRRVIN